jgi:hypothetical protein
MTGRASEVSVHIERLILDGIALGPGGADQVRAAVEAAVGQALDARGVAPALLASVSLASLDGGSIALPRLGSSGAASTAVLGQGIGAQVAGGIAGERAR